MRQPESPHPTAADAPTTEAPTAADAPNQPTALNRSRCTNNRGTHTTPAPRYEAPLRFGGACQGIFPALTSTPEPSAQSSFGVPHAHPPAMSPPGDEQIEQTDQITED